MATIAFLVDQDYEDREFQEPYDALSREGHSCVVVGTEQGKKLEGKRGKSSTTVDQATESVTPDEFDALVIPGGYSPDKLRLDDNAVAFTRRFVESGKPVAAICHAGQLLVEADVVRGKTLTSWPSIRTDLKNAGATWTNEELVEDGPLLTSRAPDDLPVFIDAIRRHLGATKG